MSNRTLPWNLLGLSIALALVVACDKESSEPAAPAPVATPPGAPAVDEAPAAPAAPAPATPSHVEAKATLYEARREQARGSLDKAKELANSVAVNTALPRELRAEAYGLVSEIEEANENEDTQFTARRAANAAAKALELDPTSEALKARVEMLETEATTAEAAAERWMGVQEAGGDDRAEVAAPRGLLESPDWGKPYWIVVAHAERGLASSAASILAEQSLLDLGIPDDKIVSGGFSCEDSGGVEALGMGSDVWAVRVAFKSQAAAQRFASKLLTPAVAVAKVTDDCGG